MSILWAATVPKQSSILKLYFVTQFAATAACELCWHFTGWQSPVYSWVYALATVCMLLASLVILIYNEVGWRESLIALAFAAALGRVAYYGMGHPLTLDNWIILLEGCALVFLGTALGFKVPFLKQRMVIITLAILWQLGAMLDFGLLLNHGPAWEVLNRMGSYILFIAAFAFIGLKQRRWI